MQTKRIITIINICIQWQWRKQYKQAPTGKNRISKLKFKKVTIYRNSLVREKVKIKRQFQISEKSNDL